MTTEERFEQKVEQAREELDDAIEHLGAACTEDDKDLAAVLARMSNVTRAVGKLKRASAA